MIHLTSIENGCILHDFNQAKSLGFVYGGDTDYYITANIYPDGMLEEDKNLMFVIDKSNIEFYNLFNSFFDTVKKIALQLKAGQNKVFFPPFMEGIECYNWYDTNKLYDEKQNQIVWSSEAGGGINMNTLMLIEEKNDEYRIIFKNDEIIKYNDRHARNVCICNSGSRSQIFPYLYWDFYQKIKELPMTMSEAEAKILRK